MNKHIPIVAFLASLAGIVLIIFLISAGKAEIPLNIEQEIGSDQELIYSSEEARDLIHVDALESNAISSPLSLSGEARGQWYFEASFPVTITDKDGNIIAQAPVQAQGEWMTEDFVSFSTEVVFSVPAGVMEGFVVLEKDNPSGLPENDAFVKIPVTFVGSAEKTPVSMPLGAGPSGSTSVTLEFGETGKLGSFEITPETMIGDSRCPTDVECIWAGTVEIEALVSEEDSSEVTVIFKLDEPVKFFEKEITLTKVSPELRSNVKIGLDAYRFTFEIV